MVDPDIQPLVIDIGHGMMKTGFSGDDAPRACFPTIVGRTRNPGIMIGMDSKDCFIGDEAQAKRNILKLRNPIPVCRDEEYNFKDIEKIFHHSFYNELSVSPEEHPLMITSLPDRMSNNYFTILSEMFFETFNVPAFHIVDPHVLSIFASGRFSGQVLECGSGTTSTISIYEGYPIQHTKMVLEDRRANKNDKKIAGDLITDILLYLWNNRHHEDNRNISPFNLSMSTIERDNLIHTSSFDREIVRRMKELYSCFSVDEEQAKNVPKRRPIHERELKEPKLKTSDNNYRIRYDRELVEYNNRKQRNDKRGTIINYSLPDGYEVTTSRENIYQLGDERFDAPEVLFNPSSVIGYNNLPGIHHLINHSIHKNKNEPELMKLMYSNIILAGGSTMIGNFKTKLYLELSKIMPQKYKNILNIVAPAYRNFSQWIGGSILSSLSTWNKEWVSKKEFDDGGPRTVQAKCICATTENTFQDPLSIFVVDQDMEERRLYAIEECFVGKRKNREEIMDDDDDDYDDDSGLEFEFRVSFVQSCVLKIRFKSLLLL